MSKKTKNISLSVQPEHDKILRDKSYELGKTMSAVAREIFIDFVDFPPDLHKKIRFLAEKKGISVSQFIVDIINKFPIDDDSVKPIMFTIPLIILGNKENLQNWLKEKSDAIIAQLHN